MGHQNRCSSAPRSSAFILMSLLLFGLACHANAADDSRTALRGVREMAINVNVVSDKRGCDISAESVQTNAQYLLASRLRLVPTSPEVLVITVMTVAILDAGETVPLGCAALVKVASNLRADAKILATRQDAPNVMFQATDFGWVGATSRENLQEAVDRAASDGVKRFIVDWSQVNR